MAKATNKKAKPKKETRGKYDEKLSVNGSFLNIMIASAKHASNNSVKKDK